MPDYLVDGLRDQVSIKSFQPAWVASGIVDLGVACGQGDVRGREGVSAPRDGLLDEFEPDALGTDLHSAINAFDDGPSATTHRHQVRHPEICSDFAYFDG